MGRIHGGVVLKDVKTLHLVTRKVGTSIVCFRYLKIGLFSENEVLLLKTNLILIG